MVTDWIRNPFVLSLTPMAVATACAFILAATRGVLSRQRPKWRVARAAFIGMCIFAASFVTSAILGQGAGILNAPSFHAMDVQGMSLVAKALAYGVFLGWLIPVVIEGTSLRQIGWRLPRVGWLIAAVVFGAIAIAAYMHYPRPTGLEQAVPDARTGWQAVLASPSFLLWAFVLAFITAAWTEENVFRGYLLGALQDAGQSGRMANLAQAALFAAVHVPAYVILTAQSSAVHSPLGWVIAGGFVTWLAMGLLFGWLRLRSGSIVPGFLVHGMYDFGWAVSAYSGVAGILQTLS